MSSGPRSHVVRRQLLPPGNGGGNIVRVAMVVPLVALLIAVVGLTVYCGNLLGEAAEGRAVSVGGLPLTLFVGGFLLASAATVVAQSLRVANRVAGPEHRLRLALQRIRTGDVGFRVHLRRGDMLTGLAEECNELLDWLNANPPRGVRTGSDVVSVGEPQEVAAGAMELEEVAP